MLELFDRIMDFLFILVPWIIGICGVLAMVAVVVDPKEFDREIERCVRFGRYRSRKAKKSGRF